MRWPWKRHTPSEDDQITLEQAREMRVKAEQALNEARTAVAELRSVAIESRRIRSENQFSLRLTEVFESRPHHHG